MRSFQGKTRSVVIEFGFMPTLVQMAHLAPAFGQARRELSRVNVGMARITALLWKDKQDFSGELSCGQACMAIAARRCEMRAAQDKRRVLMRGQREARGRKSLDDVATFAASLVRAPRELAAMFIAMAIAAELMCQFLFEIAARMAFFTGHASMLAAQREIRQIMIKCAAAYAFPSLG